MELDHLVVAAGDLEQAVAHSEEALGVRLLSGGQHARFGTHNRLLGFDGRDYFEAIAANPDAPDPGRPRWFGLDGLSGPARLVTWVCRVADLEAALAIWPQAGEVHELERGALRWRMAVPADGALHFGGVMPLLIEWQGDLHPSDQLETKGCRLQSLSLFSPDAEEVKDLLGRLGLSDPRVRITGAPQVALEAMIETPAGLRRLK